MINRRRASDSLTEEGNLIPFLPFFGDGTADIDA